MKKSISFMANVTHEDPIVFSHKLIDLLQKQEHPVEVMALYLLYRVTIQSNNQTKCTVAELMNELKWGADKVRKHRKTLLKLGLIKDVQLHKSTGGFDKPRVEVLMF